MPLVGTPEAHEAKSKLATKSEVERMDWVKYLDERAQEAAANARKLHKLTGQYDPILSNIEVHYTDGTVKRLDGVRLSDIGHWKIEW